MSSHSDWPIWPSLIGDRGGCSTDDAGITVNLGDVRLGILSPMFQAPNVSLTFGKTKGHGRSRGEVGQTNNPRPGSEY